MVFFVFSNFSIVKQLSFNSQAKKKVDFKKLSLLSLKYKHYTPLVIGDIRASI